MWCIIYYNGFILILLTLIWAMPCDASKGSDIQNLLRANKINTGFYSGPYVDGHSVTNVTTQIGTHAFLPCKVKKLGNKSVSWIRVRDGHILTVDRTTFIADDRFQALHVEHTGLWTLQIKYVQGRDAGLYECQVSDLEPKISARVNLQVVVPRTEIIGDTDRYVKADSKVQLRCIVRGALEPPSYIIWSHGADQIFPENRNGWQASIERETENDTPNTIGTLIINSAKEKDSGSYICSPSNSPPVTITLHVINAQPAEIIGDPETNISAANVSLKLTYSLFMSLYYYLILILLFYFTTFKNYL